MKYKPIVFNITIVFYIVILLQNKIMIIFVELILKQFLFIQMLEDYVDQYFIKIMKQVSSLMKKRK
jgi:hypothetical protein